MRVSPVLLRGAADFIGIARLSDMNTPTNNGASVEPLSQTNLTNSCSLCGFLSVKVNAPMPEQDVLLYRARRKRT